MANIAGTAGNDTLQGSDGQDTITGLGGDDYIDGGPGGDFVYGGSGNDTIAFAFGYGSSFVVGGDGTDTFLYRGNLVDVAYIKEQFYNYAPLPDFDYFRGIYLVDGTHVGESIRSGSLVEQFLALDTPTLQFIGAGSGSVVNGGSANDLLPGNSSGQVLNGGAGDDVIYGNEGADTLNGGDGNDYLSAGRDDGSSDVFDGGNGINSRPQLSPRYRRIAGGGCAFGR
jgi:hypothetical protein